MAQPGLLACGIMATLKYVLCNLHPIQRASQIFNQETNDKRVFYVAGVDANDVLYGSDTALVAACNELSSSVLAAAIDSLQGIDGAKRAAASFALFQATWSFADVDGDAAVASLTWYLRY